MLRVTLQPEPDRIRLKLEGNLAGMWVSEVEDSWRATHAIRGDRPLYVDLTSVEHVDQAGKYLLGLLHCCGAHLIASGTLMTELVRTLQDDWRDGRRDDGRPPSSDPDFPANKLRIRRDPVEKHVVFLDD